MCRPSVAGRRAAERVDLRVEVAQLANIADQPRRANRAGDVERAAAAGAFAARRLAARSAGGDHCWKNARVSASTDCGVLR